MFLVCFISILCWFVLQKYHQDPFLCYPNPSNLKNPRSFPWPIKNGLRGQTNKEFVPQSYLNQHCIWTTWRVWSSELSESISMAWPTYYHLLFLHGDLRGQTDEEFVSQSYLNQHWWLDLPIIAFCSYTVTFEARVMMSCSSDLSESTLMIWPTYYHLLFLDGYLRGQTDEEFVSQSYLNQHWWLDLPIITSCSYTVIYQARLMKSLFLRVIWINTDGLTHLLSLFVLTRWPTRPEWWTVCFSELSDQYRWLDPPIITFCSYTVTSETTLMKSCSSDLSESTLMTWPTYYHHFVPTRWPSRPDW